MWLHHRGNPARRPPGRDNLPSTARWQAVRGERRHSERVGVNTINRLAARRMIRSTMRFLIDAAE